MAVRMTQEEIALFKTNLNMLVPYQDQDVLNEIAKGLYSSSEYTNGMVDGIESAITINNIQIYSRHNVQKECEVMCAHLPFAKYHKTIKRDAMLLKLEESINPRLSKYREKLNQILQEKISINEERLSQLEKDDGPILDEEDTSVYVYGVGCGHVIDYLASAYPKLMIHVVVINPTVTAILMSIDQEMGKRLAKPNIKISIAKDDTIIHSNNVVIKSDLSLTPACSLKQRIEHYLEIEYVDLLNKKRKHTLNSLIARFNHPYCKIAPQLKKDSFPPCDDIVVIGPGTSLVDTLEHLKQLKQKGFRTIACDTAMIYLEDQKFIPDILAVADIGLYKNAGPFSALNTLIFKDRKLYENSSIVFTAKTHIRIPALFLGQRLLAYTDDLRRHRVEMEDDNVETDLDITQSSISFLVSLALKQHAKRIYLFGIDNVCKLESYHAGQVNSTDNKLIFKGIKEEHVLCNDGKMRRALHSYVATRIHLEEVIAQHKDVEFINCSPIGAVIKGATISDFNLNNQIESDEEDL